MRPLPHGLSGPALSVRIPPSGPLPWRSYPASPLALTRVDLNPAAVAGRVPTGGAGAPPRARRYLGEAYRQWKRLFW